MSNFFQRTPEWYQARIGKLTASRAAAIILRTKTGKPYAAYQEMLDEIVTERVTGQAVAHPTTPAMQWGIDHEDEARGLYEIQTSQIVSESPFVPHPTIPGLGASPDGLVGTDGLVEIKCPTTLVHISRVKVGVVPDCYKPQMLIQCLCTGRKWVDFVDYDPRLIGDFEPLQLFIVRYTPTEEELRDAEQKCIEFLELVDKAMADLAQLAEGAVHDLSVSAEA